MNQYNYAFDLIFDESVFLTIYYYLQRYKYYKKILYESISMNKDYPELGRSPGEPIIQGAGLQLPFSPKFHSALA